MDDLVNPSDTLERQRDKLLTICTALMRKVEQTPSDQTDAAAHIRRAALTDSRGMQQTQDFERALGLLTKSKAKLAEAQRDAQQVGRMSRQAIAALQETKDTIEALLDISKLDAGQAVFDIRPISLGAILTSLADEMRAVADRKGLTLKLIPISATVLSDPISLRRILHHFLSNAITDTDTGAVLIEAQEQSNKTVTIIVRDTVRDIAAEDQPRIFPVSASNKRAHGDANGLGHNLTIVQRVCDALGHRMTLNSEVGDGSGFSVNVARHIDDSVQPAPLHESPSSAAAIVGALVLLVERDNDQANTLMLRLEQEGAHVVHAATVADAIELLEEIELLPDLAVINDRMGSSLGGIDLHRMLQANFQKIPTLIVSADPSAELSGACETNNLHAVHLPTDHEDLLQALDRLLRDGG
ncbi:MAG: hybrid sensor histidine kinase/response regulator [Pseudomonadota bacterium]